MDNLDKVFSVVSRKLPEVDIEYLLIGGFAVNHYGYTRNTLESDIKPLCERFGNSEIYEMIRDQIEGLR